MTTEDRRPTCDYCKLPLAAGWWGRAAASRDEGGSSGAQPGSGVYCCLGCRMAAAITEGADTRSAPRAMLARLGLSVFFTMNVLAFTMALWTTDVYGPDDTSGAMMATLTGLFRYLVLLFSLPVLVLLGWPLFEHAWAGLRRGVVSTDWLLATGVGAAFAASLLSVYRGEGPIYFEVGCVILVMTTLGRWLEATGRLKAGAALDDLARLLADRVCRIVDGREESVLREDLRPGDRIHVRPGERFPADGAVARDAGLVNEQVLTGESRPAFKQPGDRILGGTLNLDGDLTIEVTESQGEGTLARVVELVRRARESKGRYQRLADRAAGVFAPAVAAIALAAFAAHWACGSLERGLWAGLSVGLIACPCALGLAAPLAVWSALGHAAGRRVLFRGGEALERLADVAAVRFDKTGTLTTGVAVVSHFEAEDPDEEAMILGRAARLASAAPHALSRAIGEFAAVDAAAGDGVEMLEVRVVPGLGAVGRLNPSGSPIVLGSRRFLTEHGLALETRLAVAVEHAESRGVPVALVGWDGRVRGLFVFDEQWRPDATAVIGWLGGAGYDVAVLTGDHAARGRAIRKALGVPVVAALLPADKAAAIGRARREFGPVCMIGDGVNDALALAASDVGIAMGCGTDVSRDSAAVCLMGDDLAAIPWSLELARRTRRTIRGSLAWAFGYNSLGVACAAMGWLNPAMAAALMVASSSLVVVNSLRLGRPFEVPIDGDTKIKPARVLGQVNEPDLAEAVAPMIELPMVFLGGLLGSAHCVGMCGGFALGIGLGAPSLAANVGRQVVYTAGRVFTYSFLGVAAGYAGSRIAGSIDAWVNAQAALCLIAGLLLVGQGLLGLGLIPRRFRAKPSGGPLCLAGTFVGPFLRSPRSSDVLLAGIFTGFLPCGLVYGFLALAGSSASIPQGLLTMALFGAGTGPLMILAGAGGSLLPHVARRNALRVSAACILLTGCISIARGLLFVRLFEAPEVVRCALCGAPGG